MSFLHSPNTEVMVRITPDTRQIVNRISRFSDKMQKKGAKRAARKAMGVVRKAAISNAKEFDDPSTPERIWRNVVIQEATRSSKRVGGVVMRVGVRGGARQYANTRENVRKGRVGKSYKTLGDSGNPGGDTWYWRFVEFGTSRVRPRKFLRNALESNVGAVMDTAVVQLNREIDKMVAEK